MQRVRETKDSVLHAQEHRFIDPVETIQGTVTQASLGGVELEEYPGRVFRFSSIGTSMADLSAVVLGERNTSTRSEMVSEVQRRQQRQAEYLSDRLAPGTSLSLTTLKGASAVQPEIMAVMKAGGSNINRELVSRGLVHYCEDVGGKTIFVMSCKCTFFPEVPGFSLSLCVPPPSQPTAASRLSSGPTPITSARYRPQRWSSTVQPG